MASLDGRHFVGRPAPEVPQVQTHLRPLTLMVSGHRSNMLPNVKYIAPGSPTISAASLPLHSRYTMPRRFPLKFLLPSKRRWHAEIETVYGQMPHSACHFVVSHLEHFAMTLQPYIRRSFFAFASSSKSMLDPS